MGRLVVMQRNQGVASNYDCNTCPCPPNFSSISSSPASYAMIPGDTEGFTCVADYVNCNGTNTYYTVTTSATWSSSNTSVATVNNSTSKGLATGVGPGSATITVSYTDNTYRFTINLGCIITVVTHTSTSTCNVQIPTSLSIVAGTDSTTSEASCPIGGSTGCGVTRTFKYQVNDQNGQPIKQANMAFGDVICNTSTNGLGLNSYATTCSGMTGSCWGTYGPCGQFTDANGQFNEKLGACSTVCKVSGVCTTAGQTVANQSWTVDGYALDSDVKSLSYQCNKVLVNGK